MDFHCRLCKTPLHHAAIIRHGELFCARCAADLPTPSPGLEPPRPAGCPSCADADARVRDAFVEGRTGADLAAVEALSRIEEEMLAHCHAVNQAEGRTPDEIMRIPKAWQPIGVILHKWRTGKILEPGDPFRSEYSRLLYNLTAKKGGMADALQAARREVDRLKAALDLEAKAKKAAADGLADAKEELDRLRAIMDEESRTFYTATGPVVLGSRAEVIGRRREAAARLAAIDAARQGEPPMPLYELNRERDEMVRTLEHREKLITWGRLGWDAAAALRVEREEQRHQANEWADIATSGLQWLRNLRDGIAFPEVAIENMEQLIGDLRAGRGVAIHDPSIRADDLVEALDDDPEPRDGFHDGHDTPEERNGER